MDRLGYDSTVPPAYTGVAFLFSWTYLLFYATSAGIEAAAPISLYSATYTISASAMCLTLIVVSFTFKKRTLFLTRTGTKVVVGAGLSLSTLALLASSWVQSIAFTIVAGATTGVFSGLMLLQWIVAYKRVGLRSAAMSFPLLMAMSVGICVTLMYLPHAMLSAAATAFPIVSEVMFHEVRKKPWPRFDIEDPDARDRPINFILMLLPFAVYAFSTGFLDYSSDNNNYTFAFYAFGAIVPLVAAGAFIFVVDRRHFLTAFAVPISFLVAVCVPFLSSPDIAHGAPFISIGELGIEVLIFVVPIGFAQFFSLDSLKTYALGRTVYVVGNAIGWYAAQFASNTYGQFLHSQASIVIIFIGVEVLAVGLIVAIVKTQKSLAIEGEQSDTAPSAEQAEALDESPASTARNGLPQGQSTAIDEIMPKEAAPQTKPREGEDALTQEPDKQDVIGQLCEEHGLSQRERDVFELLARGYTSPRIQKELFIAAGTVNYHSRNIYAKLGVHSKQELIALVESASE